MVPRHYLSKYLNLVEKVIQVIPADLVSNIDESDLSDWEEREPKIIIVSSEIDNEDLFYPINRGNRHITLVVIVSGGGDVYFPLAVNLNPELEHIFRLGVRPDVDLILCIK